MDTKLLWCLMLHTLLLKIPSINSQRSTRYLHLTGLPYTGVPVPATTPNVATTNPVTTSNQTPTSQPRPTTGLPSLSALALPNLLAGIPQPQEKPKPFNIQKPSSNIDSKLLNNLAIALQLLILSNILNSPTDPNEKLKEKISKNAPTQPQYAPTQPQYAASQPQYAPTQQQYAPAQPQYAPTQSQYMQQNQFFPPQNELVPNANFVGSSSFAEPNMMQTRKPTRSTMTLMSPYEALGTLSTFSDPTPQFSSSNPRKDFLSPYAMMDKDVFSMTDLFGV